MNFKNLPASLHQKSMFMNRLKHFIHFIFLSITASFFAQAEVQNYEAIYLDKHERHFKGPVHKVYFHFTHKKDSLDKFYKEGFMSQFDYVYKRDIYMKFSKEGLLLMTKISDMELPYKSVDTAKGEIISFEPDTKDYYLKKKSQSKLNPALRTCNQELFLKVNRSWSMYSYNERNHPEITNEVYRDVYKYNYDTQGRIIKTKEYSVLPSDTKKGIPFKLNEKYLFVTIHHQYDAKGRIIAQRVVPGPIGKGNDLVGMGESEGMPFEFMGSHAYLRDQEAKIFYKYDNQDRIIQIKFYGEGMLLSQNDYTYHPVKGYLLTNTKMEEGTAASFNNTTKRFCLTYNEQGDIIRRENFPDDPTQKFTTREDMYNPYVGGANFQNRYYKYEYDKYDNWVKCYLYMEGTPNGAPSLIAERKIEYYN